MHPSHFLDRDGLKMVGGLDGVVHGAFGVLKSL
jgi:hypothetical protein